MSAASLAYWQRLQCSWNTDIQRRAMWGWATRPTNRSVVARQRYRSLDGGCRGDSLERATRMREFPANAVMERKMSTATKKIDSCCWSPLTKEGEHCSSWNDFVWLPPLLKFVVDIILSSAFPLLPNWQSHKKFSVGSKKLFFPRTFGCLCYEIAIKGKYRNICYFNVFTVRQRVALYQN